jgi:hypothetical protein
MSASLLHLLHLACCRAAPNRPIILLDHALRRAQCACQLSLGRAAHHGPKLGSTFLLHPRSCLGAMPSVEELNKVGYACNSLTSGLWGPACRASRPCATFPCVYLTETWYFQLSSEDLAAWLPIGWLQDSRLVPPPPYKKWKRDPSPALAVDNVTPIVAKRSIKLAAELSEHQQGQMWRVWRENMQA